MLEEINLVRAKVVISTIPEYDTNEFLLKKIRKTNREASVVLLSYNIDEALKLYELGANYVILPHFISGEFAAKLASESGFNSSAIKGKKTAHVKYLKERKALGHLHPTWMHNV